VHSSWYLRIKDDLQVFTPTRGLLPLNLDMKKTSNKLNTLKGSSGLDIKVEKDIVFYNFIYDDEIEID
jgi:hypothetical protein